MKINVLINEKIFRFVRYNPIKYKNVRLYKIRMVRKIKNKLIKLIEKL